MKYFVKRFALAFIFLCSTTVFSYGQDYENVDPLWEKENAKWEANIKNSYFSASELIDIVDAYSKSEITKIIINKGGWESVDWKICDKSTHHFHRYDSLLQVYDENYSFFITNSPAYGDENTPGYNWESTLCTGKRLEVFFHSEGKVVLTYCYAYAPEFREQFVDLGFKSETKQKTMVDKTDINGEWTAEKITEFFVKDNYKLVITTEELGEMDDCGMSTEVLLYKSTEADINVSATSSSDSQAGPMQQQNDQKSGKKLLVFLIVSLLVFFILFRISYKKRYAIFIGTRDLVLLVVSAVAFVAAFVVIPNYTENVIWLVLAALIGALAFGFSVRMSLKHCPDTTVKVISIVAKVAFLSSAILLIIIIEYCRIQRNKERRENHGYSNWDKFLDYWEELKDLASRGEK
jgi:hypothetical protein